jgi:L-ascorbate metabolism protein UlaG (beta-lactamase superfamily)
MTKLDRGCRITWLGHAALRVDTPGGKVLLFDPWLTNPKAPAGALAALDRVDVLLLTHGHSDHLGETVAIGRRFQPEVPCIFELHLYLQSQGLERTRPMNKGGSQVVAGGIRVTMTHADHSAAIEDPDQPGRLIYGGEPCGFVVELENGFRLYFAGDTALFGDMALIRDLHAPEMAVLPIGDLYTMGPRAAAAAARLLGARHVLPVHFGTFPPLTGTPAELARELAGSGIAVAELTPGEPWS